MSAQWTKKNPGLGDMESLAGFDSALTSDLTQLDDALSTLLKVEGAIHGAWQGDARDAFIIELAKSITDLETFQSATSATLTAVRDYVTSVESIARRADTQIEVRDEAAPELDRTYMDSTTSPPSDAVVRERKERYDEALEDHTSAVKKLDGLAEERQEADDVLVAVLRDRGSRITPLDMDELLSRDRGSIYTGEYDYSYAFPISDDIMLTPEQAMDIFKANPGKIFPFEIEGATTFEDGQTIRLVGAAPIDGSGDVRVSTTDTSVTFTVVSDDYFDGAGSTITFRTAIGTDGLVYLVQDADAHDANAFAAIGAENGGAALTWNTQAQNFRDVLAEEAAK